MCRTPSAISVRSRAPGGRGTGSGSGVRMSATVTALTTKDNASASTARAAPTSVIRPPPTTGPVITATDRDVPSLAFPSSRWPGPSRLGG